MPVVLVLMLLLVLSVLFVLSVLLVLLVLPMVTVIVLVRLLCPRSADAGGRQQKSKKCFRWHGSGPVCLGIRMKARARQATTTSRNMPASICIIR